MNPDISYIARFDKKQKGNAIKELEAFCVNTEDYQFDHNLITKDCMIIFMLDDEESTKWYKTHHTISGKIEGKTLVGYIQLWIKDEEDFCDFEFWAVASRVGRACLDSKNLKIHLIDFIKKLDGQSLMLDDGKGNFEMLYDN